MDESANKLFSNRFLALLPREDFARLHPFFKISFQERGTLLIHDGWEVEHVYFPLSGMISLLVVTNDGDSIETATVGREGMAGVGAGLGLHIANVKGVVQMPGVMAELSAVKFRSAVGASPTLRDLCVRYSEVILIQAQTTVACNALHSIEQRFCRWLLQSRRINEDDRVPLTQEFMSEMLGVQRSSISVIAAKLQKLGLIHYTRGQIQILNRSKLEALSCECLETIEDKTAVIWPRQ